MKIEEINIEGKNVGFKNLSDDISTKNDCFEKSPPIGLRNIYLENILNKLCFFQ